MKMMRKTDPWALRLRALAASIPGHAVLLDRTGNLLWSKGGSAYLTKLQLPEYRAALNRALRTRVPQRIEMQRPGKDGAANWFRCVITPVLHGREVREILLLCSDITEQRDAAASRGVTARVVAAAENERRRVSRELHDSVNQLLAAVGHGLRAAQSRLPAGEPAADDVRRSSAMLTEAIEEVRRIARNLRPPLLDDLGLLPALRMLAQEFTENSRIKTSLDLPLEEPGLAAEAKLALYRIVQEALSNADRHSGAARVRVKCASRLGRLNLSIEDDGKGFEPSAPVSYESSGLANLRERAALVAGSLNVRSGRGQGTTIEVSVPLGRKTSRRSRS